MNTRYAVLFLALLLVGIAGCSTPPDDGGNDADAGGDADADGDGDGDADGDGDGDGDTDGDSDADADTDADADEAFDGDSDMGETPAYPAQPEPGTIFWGAAIAGNGDPVERHEEPSGHTLSIHRTFFQWDQRTGYLMTVASDDVDSGRLPWVSVKTPPWDEMAAGDHDAEIDELLEALDALDGPVWLTVHHEPEGGGGVNEPDDPAGPAGHVAMNRQVRARMTALDVDNIALAPILMSWTWNPASGRDPDEWWEDGIYDFLGVDHYRDSEESLLTDVWFDVREWAEPRGVDVAVGEWGMRGTDSAAGDRVRAWYEHGVGSATDGAGARVVALSAFDSGLNSPTGSWELVGAQLEVFQELLGDPRTAHVP